MTSGIRSTIGTSRTDVNRRKGLVKSLILDYENLLSGNVEGMLNMGNEQSCNPKLLVSNSNRPVSIVKQRVSQFDDNSNSETVTDNKKRHKFTIESTKTQVITSKDFQRSKSVDINRKEKDRYQRIRVVSPRINEHEFKFETQIPRPSTNKDTNNKNAKKKKSIKRTTQRPKTTGDDGNKTEKSTRIIVNTKSTERIKVSEKAVPILETKRDTKNYSSTIIKDDGTKIRKSVKVSNDTNKKKVRSVKSIKKVFENGEPKSNSATTKKFHRNEKLSDVDNNATTRNGEATSENTFSPGKHIETDNNLSEHVVYDMGAFNDVIIKKSSRNYRHVTHTQLSPKDVSDLESYRKSIWNDIAEKFYADNGSDVDENYADDEFDEINTVTKNDHRKVEIVSNNANKKKVKSVKSIKKIFENSEQKSSTIISKKLHKELDKATTRNREVSGETKHKHTETDKELSQNVVDDFTIKESRKTYLPKTHTQPSSEDDTNLKKKNDDRYNTTKTFDTDLDDNYTDDEFQAIKMSLEEMEEDLKIMKAHRSLTNLQIDKIIDVKEAVLKSTEDSNNDEEEEEPENINVFIRTPATSESTDDEFGQRSFGSSQSINFTEAYNRLGDELVETTVANVEHRKISGHFDSKESLYLEGQDQSSVAESKPTVERPSLLEKNDDNSSSAENETILKEASTNDEKNHDDSKINSIQKITTTDNIKASEDSALPEVFLSKNGYASDSDNSNVESEHSAFSEDSGNAVENKMHFPAKELQISSEQENEGNRSTIYSNTNTNSTDSMEILSKTESDDGIQYENDDTRLYEEVRLENNVEIRSGSSNAFDRTFKTETFYDSFQNPRIAKVSNINSSQHIPVAETTVVNDASALEPKTPTELKPKKDYIIEELINTEENYIKQLEVVVKDYMPALTDKRLPNSLVGKSQYLFGNIKKIYVATQKFYKALQSCGTDHEEIAKTFLDFKHLFELYPHYSKNKPKADQYLSGDFKELVSVQQRKLIDRLGLGSNLLTPIQRLGKYILFLEQIQKELLKREIASDNIYKAIETVRRQMSRGNDFLAIDSIQDSPISLQEQGSFIMRDKFNIIKPRKYEAMLFLFEEILVMTTVDLRNPEMFIYRESIKLNEMGIVTFDDQPLVFHLKRFPSYKKGPKEHNEFVIEAKKSKDKKTWTEEIEKRLWDQLVKCKEEQRELHKNQGKRNSVVELPKRVRKKNAGYNSLPSEMRKSTPKSIFYYKVDRDA